jgi:hypothetical protein
MRLSLQTGSHLVTVTAAVIVAVYTIHYVFINEPVAPIISWKFLSELVMVSIFCYFALVILLILPATLITSILLKLTDVPREYPTAEGYFSFDVMRAVCSITTILMIFLMWIGKET